MLREFLSSTKFVVVTHSKKTMTAATTLYEDCKKRRAEGAIDRQLFLDLEEVWQLLVKTGVAGVRTKSMVDSELAGFTS